MFTLDSTNMILAGLLAGLVFGFLLQRAHVTRYQIILGQFLLKDFTVVKVMLTAIIVGSIGIYAMLQLNMIEHLHVKPAALVATTLGGLIFGVGMALLGYCPGTGVAAVGEGSRHAIVGVLGMIVGAGLFAEVYPFIQDNLLAAADLGKVTFVDITRVPAWGYIAILTIAGTLLFYFLERWEKRGKSA